MVAPARPEPPIVVVVGPYFKLAVAEAVTGYTVKAIERKIERGEWVEGREWISAPDKSRLISLEGYRKWAERGRGSK